MNLGEWGGEEKRGGTGEKTIIRIYFQIERRQNLGAQQNVSFYSISCKTFQILQDANT